MVRRTGAPRDTLAARLRTLVGGGVLERRQYSEQPARYEYRLTEAGRDLYPVIAALMRWGDKHLADDGGPPLVLGGDKSRATGERGPTAARRAWPARRSGAAPRER